MLDLAAATSPDVLPDIYRAEKTQSVITALASFPFLKEHLNTYYDITDNGDIVSGKYLMSGVHKMWDALREPKCVKIGSKTYNNPKELIEWILMDRWTSAQRVELMDSAIQFMIDNKDKEIDTKNDIAQIHNLYVTTQEFADILESTSSVSLEAPTVWSRFNYLGDKILKSEMIDKEEVDLVQATGYVMMYNILTEMKNTPTYNALYAPTPSEEEVMESTEEVEEE
jgi:hypothetical protein